MAAPSPTPIGWSGAGNIYRVTQEFALEDWGWSEGWDCVVAGSTAPLNSMTTPGQRLSQARLTGLNVNARIEEVRLSYADYNPVIPIRQSYPGENASDGCGSGGVGGPGRPVWLAWFYSFWDSSLTIHERRDFRGISVPDDTWTPDGDYPVPPNVNAMVNQMIALLKVAQPGSFDNGLGGGTVRFAIKSSQITGASPAPTPVISVGVNSNNMLNFTVGSALQKGWDGSLGSPNTLTDIAPGDVILAHGNIVPCLKGVNGTWRVISIGAGTPSGVLYQTNQPIYCSTGLLPQWIGTLRAQQWAYYGFDSAYPIREAKKNTGRPKAESKGRK